MPIHSRQPSLLARLWVSALSAGCLLLSPVISAHANLADVDCMAAADPDACIAQLTDIAEPAPVATPAAESTPANSDATTTETSKPTEPAKPTTVKSKPTKPKKSASTKPATSTTNKSATAPSSAEAPTTTDTQLAAAASAETSTTTIEQPAPAPAPKPVKHVVKKPQPHTTTKSTSPAVTLAGTPAPQPAPVVSASPTAQPTVTLAGTPTTPAPQPKPPVYMTATSPEPVKPDLIADTMNCQKTPDPDQCVRNLTQKQGTPANFSPQNLPLNTDALGWSGPVKAALRYDSELSWILGLDYVQMLSESVGLSVKTGFGPNERRANVTTGFAVTPDQHIKLTYEYLTQNLNFDFVTGGVQEWVDQHAIGGAYQYLLRHEILHSFEISGYTVRANSKDLSDVIYNVQTDDHNNTTSYDVNNRRIAGGTENTIQAALNLLPIKNTALTIGGGFSSLSYDTQYEDNQAKSTIAYQAQLTHLLTDTLKFVAGVNSSASGTTHSAEIRHILPKDIELSLKGEYMSSTTLPNSSSVTLGISYPAPKAYSIAPFSGMQELKNWIEKPIVYKTRVLAIKDERNIHVQPLADNFTQTIYTGPTDLTPDITKIVPIPMTGMFLFQDPALTINYQCSVSSPVSSSVATCADLNLAVGVPPSAQTTQLYSTASVPVSTANTDPYVITITATATRPGLQDPLVEKGTLTLHVYNQTPSFPTTPQAIAFDTTGGDTVATAPLTVRVDGLHEITDGIDLTALATGGGANANKSFTFANPANPPAYWQILQSSNPPNHYYLLRNLDAEGRLNAQDIGSTVTLSLCIYDNDASSQCIVADINASVTADNAGSIHVDLPTPFQIQSHQTLPGWDFAPPASISSLVSPDENSNTVTIPIINDTLSSWVFNSLTPSDWTASLTPNFNGSVLVNNTSSTSITAPTVSAETLYSGTFNVNSVAKGGSVGTANTSFGIIVTIANNPLIWDTTQKEIRFDLTNGNQDAGLKPRPGEQVIDLTAMVTDSSDNVVENATFSWEDPNDPLTANWSSLTTPCPSNPAHVCLFRAIKASTAALQAGDIGQKAPIICAQYLGVTSCQPGQNFTVTADTKLNSQGYPYIQAMVPNFANLFTVCGSKPVNASLAFPNTRSYFTGESLALGSTAIKIDNDVFSNWNNLARTSPAGPSDWNLALSNTTGSLTGTAPIVSSNRTEHYTFTANSVARGGPVLFVNSPLFFNITITPPCP